MALYVCISQMYVPSVLICSSVPYHINLIHIRKHLASMSIFLKSMGQSVDSIWDNSLKF